MGEKATTRNEEYKATFTLPYNEGVIKAVGVSGNQEMESTYLRTAGGSKKLKLTADRKEIIADGQDLSFVTIEIIDTNGNFQPDAEIKLKFNIEGPGEIIGVDNANTRDTAPYVSNTRKAWRGRALVVIKSKRTAGNIKLSVGSEGLPDAKITIKASNLPD
jgi:beta-galactosidase